MQVADLILPVFAVILTGWIVGYTGYLSRALSDALIHFAYNIAMPALLVVTIAQRHATADIAMLDLIQEGNMGLMVALARFLEKPCSDFSTQAAVDVEEAILKAIAGS